MNFSLLGFTLLLSLSTNVGSQTLQQIFPQLESQKKITYLPEVNRETTAELGNTLLRSYWSVTGKKLAIKDEVKCDISGQPGSFLLPRNSQITLVKEDKNGFIFRVSDLMLVMGSSGVRSDLVQVFVSKSSPYSAKVIKENLFSTQESDCQVTVDYVDFKIDGTDDLKKELIYTGISKGVISLTYREFIKDMARPAFAQELRFDLAEGRTIGFKGARFNVIEANNVEIRYEVLKPLE